MTSVSLLRQDPSALATPDLARLVGTNGKCVGAADPDAWFPREPHQGGAETAEAVANRRADYERNARDLCAGCPLTSACLELALREEIDLPRTRVHGIRGGTAPWERLRLLPRRRRAIAQAVSA
jgi:transcription factor WhiB